MGLVGLLSNGGTVGGDREVDLRCTMTSKAAETVLAISEALRDVFLVSQGRDRR